MRSIKFRAWLKKRKVMGKVLTINLNKKPIILAVKDGGVGGITWFDLNNENAVVMQYTGLKDKNGKEIYEGDILGKQFYVNAIVSYDDGAFEQGWNCRRKHRLDQDFCSSREVIGNIYQDKELLND